jgi:hypothetical protein
MLRRVSGIIEDIAGPQAGSIRIGDGRLTAFFTPRSEFLQTRDINQMVEFYLGFSYEGLRAWAVTYPGLKPKALQIAELHQESVAALRATETKKPTSPPKNSGEQFSASESPPPIPRQSIRPKLGPVDLDQIRKIAAGMSNDGPFDYKTAIIELILQAHEEDQPLTSLQLGEALQTRFGRQSYQEFRSGPGKLRRAVERLGFRTVSGPSWFSIDLP